MVRQYLPSEMVLNSDNIVDEYRGQLEAVDIVLVDMDFETAQRSLLSWLLIKILAEIEQGDWKVNSNCG